MSTCGIWRTPRRLVAVLVEADDAEPSAPVTVPLAENARWGFAVWLQSKGVAELILSDELARCDPIAATVLRHGIRVWLAPASVVEGVRKIAGLTKRPAKHTAALLARWGTAASLRPYLRAAIIPVDDRQLHLWRDTQASRTRSPPRNRSPERPIRESHPKPSRDNSVKQR